MPKKLKKVSIDIPETLFREILSILETARSTAHRAVNARMVESYGNVGRVIVEHE